MGPNGLDIPSGAEYTSTACADTATRLSLFASVKVELADRKHYTTRAEARADIFAWIAYYNRRRLHSSRDYLPPVEWERRHHLTDPITSPVAA